MGDFEVVEIVCEGGDADGDAVVAGGVRIVGLRVAAFGVQGSQSIPHYFELGFGVGFVRDRESTVDDEDEKEQVEGFFSIEIQTYNCRVVVGIGSLRVKCEREGTRGEC